MLQSKPETGIAPRSPNTTGGQDVVALFATRVGLVAFGLVIQGMLAWMLLPKEGKAAPCSRRCSVRSGSLDCVEAVRRFVPPQQKLYIWRSCRATGPRATATAGSIAATAPLSSRVHCAATGGLGTTHPPALST